MQTTGPSLPGVRVVLAVTGSIAAYKAVSLLRLLRRGAATVNVVMTAGACRFVTPLTFEVLSGAHVATVEHLMAALFGMGIDNVVVEIDGERDGAGRALRFHRWLAGRAHRTTAWAPPGSARPNATRP